MMIVVDAHQDIAYNALGFGRDYRQPVLLTRAHENRPMAQSATLGLPDALLGRVAVTFATLFVEPRARQSLSEMPEMDLTYGDAQEANRKAMLQLDYYHRLADEDKRVRLIHTAKDLDAVLETWQPERSIGQRQQGFVILMEGADPIIEPKEFEAWYERGVRIVGPAWSGTRYSGGTSAPGPLTPEGRRLLEVMASFNALLDLSHMAEDAFYEALDLYPGTIIASHSNPRKFRDTDRHLSDAMIRRLAERDGVMGVVLFNRFLTERWTPGDAKNSVKLSVAADVIDHVCQVTGNTSHIGIGSDLDGGFGWGAVPDELDSVMDLLQIAALLQERGYAMSDVEAIMGGNMLRQIRKCLP
jgi:membrane dipeptidase